MISDATWWNFSYCECKHNTLPLNIISQGFFPGSPVIPQVAFHFDLLILYESLNTATLMAVELFQTAVFQVLKENGYEFGLM